MTVIWLVIESESEVRECRRHFIYKNVILLMQSVPYTFYFHFQTFLFFSLSEVDLESFQDTCWFAAKASTLLLQVKSVPDLHTVSDDCEA